MKPKKPGTPPEHCEPPRPRRIVERTWYFDDECRPAECVPCDPCEPECHPGNGGRPPGRPSRGPGQGTGRIPGGGGLTPGDINSPDQPGTFVGPRADMDLPYLFMRANPGDLGARPVVGAPFWESPDIFILAGVAPELAPAVPPALGQIGLAGQPNTLYAHIWNFGKAAASNVLVEFYWVNPALGIDASSVQLIAQTVTAIGARGSGRSHVIVKCPEAWTPRFLNGGHECLLVRVWDNPSDLPGEPKFDASWNRHVAQRNIHVTAPDGFHLMRARMSARERVAIPAAAPSTGPLLLQVGQLYGAPAEVKVERVAPHTMPWLQLHTGQRGVFPLMAAPTGAPTLTPPGVTGGGMPSGPSAAAQWVHGDGQQVGLGSSDDPPGPGEAHVYRVSATQNGHVFGGYTVVVMG